MSAVKAAALTLLKRYRRRFGAARISFTTSCTDDDISYLITIEAKTRECAWLEVLLCPDYLETASMPGTCWDRRYDWTEWAAFEGDLRWLLSVLEAGG